MAFVDGYGSIEAATVDALPDVTHRRFEQVVADLLPRGRAWDRDDPVLQELVASLATELSRVDLRGEKLLRELDPSTAFETLEDWEAMLGLPDCPPGPTTVEGRRLAILAKLLAQTGHDQSLGYWTDLLETLGYEMFWLAKGQDVMTCTSDCDDLLLDEEWAFVWEMAVSSGDDDALLECVVGHQALIETLPLVHYLWQLADAGAGTETLRSVACTMTGYVCAISIGAKFYRASADLATWTEEVPPTAADYYCIAHGGAAGSRLIAAGQAGVVILSDDGGDTWTDAADATAITVEAYGLSRSYGANDTVVAVGETGGTWRSTNAGDTWAAVASPTTEYLRAVTRCTGALVAVGDASVILRSTDHGASWSDVSPGISAAALYAVSAWESTVIAVGEGGGIFRSDDAGLTWSSVSGATPEVLRGVTSSPTGRWTACGDNGAILQSLDDGVTWTVMESPTTETLYAAGVDWPTGRTLVVGDNRTIVLE